MSILTTMLSTGTTNSNVGTIASGSTVTQEFDDGAIHTTTISVNTTLPSIAGGANLAVGKLIYTFPTGNLVINSCYMTLEITQTQAYINANTPDVGMGTLIGSGANATLAAVGSGCTNVISHQTAADCNGTATVVLSGTQLLIPAANSHNLYFNAAANWAASGDTGALLTGTVVINWTFLA